MNREREDHFPHRAAAFDASDDVPSNPTRRDTLGDLINRRMGRRTVLKGMLAASALAAVGAPTSRGFGSRKQSADIPGFEFEEIHHGVDTTHHVAPGYDADILIRWGDPLFPDAPPFEPAKPSAAAQMKQFGYNNDYIGFLPLDESGDRGLLCVNHEYTNEEIMFPDIPRQDRKAFADMTPELAAVEMAAHGGTIVAVERRDGLWRYRVDSPYNRRITASTPMEITGPAAGDARMKTNADPGGRRVLGTLNNCAGGMTPWGTYLMAEENFHGYFWNKHALPGHTEAKAFKRYGLPGGWYNWGQYQDRFDIGKEPNEANRFGWIVEVDPMNPGSTPKKRTALGRFKHEGAETIVNADGRVVVYSGDDQRFDYVYKFVSAGQFNPAVPSANRELLDEGTLYVARFDADGTVRWLPLVQGEGPLTAANGFKSQADVLIGTRLAADLVGATPMDRPEDVEANPKTGMVYVMLTNNSERTPGQADAVHRRTPNPWGLVLEIGTPDANHAATTGTWDILVACGDPNDARVQAKWNPATSNHGWFANPDNCAVDPEGRLWISTDQGSGWKDNSGGADGLWALGTEGAGRGTGRMFFRVPVGAELCGPCFTPDAETLFVAVQHPASDGVKRYAPFDGRSTYRNPATRWPDFEDDMPPRPSVVAITKRGGGTIGG